MYPPRDRTSKVYIRILLEIRVLGRAGGDREKQNSHRTAVVAAARQKMGKLQSLFQPSDVLQRQYLNAELFLLSPAM